MVFKNNIYSGVPKGFYDSKRFNIFLNKLQNVSESLYDQKHEAELFAYKISGIPIFVFYNFKIEDGKLIDNLDVYSITDIDGLGEIENLILEEAKKSN